MGTGTVVVAGGTGAIVVASGYAYLNQLRAEAKRIADANGITDPELLDAFRHTYTSAELTRLTGNEALVKTLGDVVEVVNPNNWSGGMSGERDRNQDLLNNRTGREIGSTSSSQQDSVNKIIDALNRGDLVTKPQEDPRTYPEHFPKDLIPWPFPDSEAPPSPYINNDPHQCTQDDADGDGIPDVIDPHDSKFDPDLNDLYLRSRTWTPPPPPPRRDPLTLDLDGDGIETTGVTGTVLFDHDGDGIRTGSGWVGADDGLLVLDRNGNGQIDNGAELFGADTLLANGQKASDGFAALRDLDSNGDNVFDAQDARFADVRVWRDLSQNGVSQAGELFTLETLGITAINLNAANETVDLGNGNLQTASATYVRANGTTGEAAGVALGETAANLELAQNPFFRQFTDTIALTGESGLLPQMQGSGMVRDLREAASLSPELAAAASAYAGQTTRAGQMALLDGLITAWAGTAGMATSVEQAENLGYKLIYLSEGQLVADYDILLSSWDASSLIDLTPEARERLEQLRDQQAETALRVSVLERFNGRHFVETIDMGGVTTGQGWRLEVVNFPGGTPMPHVYVSLLGGQDSLLNASYQSLKDSVYAGLLMQTRLKPYADAVALQVDAGGLHVDFSGVTAMLAALRETDATNALIDMVELHQAAGSTFYSLGWDALPLLRSWINDAAGDAALRDVLAELSVKYDPADLVGTDRADIILGQADNDALFGGRGNDVLGADAGADYLNGGAGSDVLDGGADNDTLYGDDGADAYLFARGFGQDVVYDYDLGSGGQDVIRFAADILPAEVAFSRDATNLYLKVSGTEDRITVLNFFSDPLSRIERVEFADGTAWDEAALMTAKHLGTEEAESLYGSADNETFEAGGGDDGIYAGDGDDTVYTGTGSDYVAAGSGNDLVYGQEGDDYLIAGEGADLLDGDAGNDTLVAEGGEDALAGGTGADYLNGGAGSDVLDGGADNDTLYAGDGADAYLFARGFGQDVVYDYDEGSGGQDVIRFAADILPAEVAFSRDAANLYLKVSGTEDRITVVNFFSDPLSRIERVEFADGTAWDEAALMTAKHLGTVEAESLYGSPDNETFEAGGGDDGIYAGGGDDTVYTGTGSDYVDAGNGNDLVYGQEGDDYLVAGEGADLLDGDAGNDTLVAEGGEDALAGGTGDDYLDSGAGNDISNGGAGNDTLADAAGNNLLVGGSGNDVISLGDGANIMAFNCGDGQDTINLGAGAGNKAISLGGSIDYTDLVFRKSASDLILDTGAGEGITLKDWFAAPAGYGAFTLQVIAETLSGFDPLSGDPLLSQKVQTFDFNALAGRFDAELAADPAMTGWNLMNGLPDAHLAASDTAALGGDLAYQYGVTGVLTGTGLAATQEMLAAPLFGLAPTLFM